MARYNNKDISAFIGPTVALTGALHFDGVVRLDGRFTGEIRSSGTLVIGETAVVEAEVWVDTVIVSGQLHGNINARNRVQLHAPARVSGNISTLHLVIDDGVLFEGQSQRFVQDEITIEGQVSQPALDDKGKPLPALTEK